MSHVVIDPCGVRPVALDGYKSEALLRDQLARDALAHPVEFRRAMGGFAEQHDPGVADAREQWIQLRVFDCVEWFAIIRHGLGEGLVRHSLELPRRRRSLLGRRPSLIPDERYKSDVGQILAAAGKPYLSVRGTSGS
jgi:hypothetical protein